MVVPRVEVVPATGVDRIGCPDGKGQAKDFAQILKLLANESRLTILGMLKWAAPEGVGVAELVKALRLSQPTISHHLRLLVASGMVDVVSKGTHNIYTINAAGAEYVADSLKTVVVPPKRTSKKK